MNKSDLKGLWMPSEILINNKLSDKEKIILSMIIYLSKDKGSVLQLIIIFRIF